MLGSLDHPFGNIVDLLNFLHAERQLGDIFRGQTSDYPLMTPSVFRSAVVFPDLEQTDILVSESKLMSTLTRTQKLRWQMMARLIERLGAGLGNLLAQQYGLSSECIDITEDPAIAAFFATRRWPEYEHYDKPGIGVIYRWRGLPDDYRPTIPTLSHLTKRLTMGKVDDDYIDRFDKPKDWRGDPGLHPYLASTLPVVMSWSEIHDLMKKERGSQAVLPKGYFEISAGNVTCADWITSRTAGQKGGFIRPRMTHRALLPNNYGTIPDFVAAGIGDDGLPWPRITPGYAIKDSLQQIENMRLHPACSRFYFEHSSKKVTGLYRRQLWPEPSEDDVYAMLWQFAFVHLNAEYINEPDDQFPAIDGLKNGLLDRGYRVRGEKETRDARELSDLQRGQLEDAIEAIDDVGSGKHYGRASAALAELSRPREALAIALQGVRRNPRCADALMALTAALYRVGKKTWSKRTLHVAFGIRPQDPLIRHSLAFTAMEDDRYEVAAAHLDAALESYDPIEHRNFEQYILMERAIVAGVLNQQEILKATYRRLAELGFETPVAGVTAQINDRLARLASKAQSD